MFDVAEILGTSFEERGISLLERPEDQWFERKGIRVSPRTLADLEAGMANAEGGVIVIGLGEGKVEGVDGEPGKVNALRQAAIDFTQPPAPTRSWLVKCVNSNGRPDHLLVIEVEVGPTVHANTRDEVYLRVGDENRRLSFIQRQELTYDKGQAAFDGTIARGATDDDLDWNLVERYTEALEHPDPFRLLVARSLVTAKDRLTVACVLLFATDPQAYFPEAYVRVIRHRGTQRTFGARQDIAVDERCEGPIPIVIERARTLVMTNQPTRQALGPSGRFETQALIPQDAWLEGLVNAVIHRSYSLGGDHVRVEIFDDRIEIESPGRFPGLVNPEKLEAITRFARNPRIARVCTDLRIGQELGEGIRRMHDEMRLAGLEPPLYDQTPGSARLTLSAHPLDPELERRLPPGSRHMLDAFRTAGGGLSTGDLSQLFGLSRPTTLRRLRVLEEIGLVEWIGQSEKDPRARWVLKAVVPPAPTNPVEAARGKFPSRGMTTDQAKAKTRREEQEIEKRKRRRR